MSRLPTLVGLGYGAYLLYAFWTGALYFYIHPFYIVPTVATGVVLLALAAVASRAADTPGDHSAPSRLALGILLLPLALGFLLPPQPLSPASAAQRGVDVLSAGGGEGHIAHDKRGHGAGDGSPGPALFYPAALSPACAGRRPAIRLALIQSRFMRAMFSTLMRLGQAASHSSWFVQWPKPSASICATILSTRP